MLQQFNQRLAFAFLLTGFVIINAAAPRAAFGDRPPNIVVIVSDDQGWADIGYHNDEIKSPNLDRLCAAGVELDCHYVQPQCTPTRVALLTGRYPSRFGMHCTSASNQQAVPHGTLTMASMLKSRGYKTGIFGKWHLGSKPEWGPNHFGFDTSYGSLAGAVGMYDHRYRLKSPFVETWHRNHEFVSDVGHATDLVTAEAIRFLGEQKDEPFFLYVPYHSVHTPLVEDIRWLKQNEHIKSSSRRLFAAAVTHLDHCVGQLVSALEKAGHAENTILLFTSDNGGLPNYGGGNYPPPDPALKNYSSNLPLNGRKTDVYEGGYRVPAFIHWPKQWKPQKLKTPMHVVDWMPTFATLCDYPIEEDLGWDGVDVGGQLRGLEPPADSRQFYINWGGGSKLALRDGDWKILRNGKKDSWKLFNLKEDPNETNDLSEKRPDKLNALRSEIEKQRKRDKQ